MRNVSQVTKIRIAILLVILMFAASTAAQTDPPSIPQWAAVVHRLSLKSVDKGHGSGPPGVFPAVIPRHFTANDASGTMETYNPGGPTKTGKNPFFQSLGSNGRACVTCHEPRSAWGVSAESIQQRFEASGGDDPIFRPVDGATCDTDAVDTIDARRKAYKLLLSKGLLRIFLPLPAAQLGSNPPVPRDFEITGLKDPYGCTDLSSTPAIVSMYRRPLVAANLRFLTECPSGELSCKPLSIMWDGREPSLESQATDATLGHAQGLKGPTPEQLAQIVGFESGIYDAQVHDDAAGHLDKQGGNGGPEFLSHQDFFIGINDSLGAGFHNVAFSLYDEWQNLGGTHGIQAARGSIARGEALFDSKSFTITDVNGLNGQADDPMGHTPIKGFCTTCHDSPNVGNHSKILALNIGVADAAPPFLDVSGLPLFTVQCTGGPLNGQSFDVTDLGRALISGKCADVGKFKGPILRGLAARAPYFHNGSAATLQDVVDFYNTRFSIGLTSQEKQDLVAFLSAL